jgi:hypothetical protein
VPKQVKPGAEPKADGEIEVGYAKGEIARVEVVAAEIARAASVEPQQSPAVIAPIGEEFIAGAISSNFAINFHK